MITACDPGVNGILAAFLDASGEAVIGQDGDDGAGLAAAGRPPVARVLDTAGRRL
jgi:hypothetical protein